ncbi:MAG: helix-turn-helix domain-containing protein [Puniceicoccales bacterium]|nr:helix-turn-helix domain-containing protein [Puniceicoccales bacterium]
MPKKKSIVTYKAPALEKGLDILEMLAQRTSSANLTEIARSCKRSVSEVQRMVNCLFSRGYIIRNEQGGYALSCKMFVLSAEHPPLRNLAQRALPYMQQFSSETFESVHIARLEGSNVLVVTESKGYGLAVVSVRPGLGHAAIESVSGRIILAYVEPHAVASTPALAGLSASRLSELQPVFEAIRRDGFHQVENQLCPEVSDLGVPIRAGENGPVFAALTTTFFSRRSAELGPRLRRSLEEAALAISKEL